MDSPGTRVTSGPAIFRQTARRFRSGPSLRCHISARTLQFFDERRNPIPYEQQPFLLLPLTFCKFSDGSRSAVLLGRLTSANRSEPDLSPISHASVR